MIVGIRNTACRIGCRIGLALLALSFSLHAAAALDRLDFRTPGADKALVEVLRQASPLLAAQRDKLTEAQDIFAAAQAEYGRLLGALYAEGYYSGVIRVALDGREAADIAPLAAPDRIGTVIVTVEPGPRFLFVQATVAPLADGTRLPDRFAIGRIARSGAMEQAVLAGIDGWRAAGHAKAAASGQEVTADHLAHSISARFALTPGPRLRFGTLTITGNDTVREARIRAIAGFPSGQQFDPAALERAAKRLRATGTFKSVTLVEAETIGPGDTLGVSLTLVEQPPRRLGFGAELASLDGLTLSGFWLHRNLLGGAESLRLEGKVSGIGGAVSGADASFALRFSRPGTPDPDTSAYLTVAVEHEDEVDFNADRGAVTVGFSRALSDRFSAEIGLSFAYERSQDKLGTVNFSTLALPLSVTWDRRDIVLNPTNGSFLKAGLTPFAGFNDAANGAHLTFDGRIYRQLGSGDGLILAARVQGGAVFGAGLFETPRDYLFYSGGGGTVRGQPYQSLGVVASCASLGGPGCVIDIGGQSFLGLSGEVRAGLGKNLGLVGFADAGFIGQGLFTTGDWHAGAGLGLRYNTGIGPIRLDVAAPVGGTTGNGVQVYVGIGQAF